MPHGVDVLYLSFKELNLSGMQAIKHPHTILHYIHTFFSTALSAHSVPRPLIQFRNHFTQTVGLL
jgi:hypothetical protein